MYLMYVLVVCPIFMYYLYVYVLVISISCKHKLYELVVSISSIY